MKHHLSLSFHFSFGKSEPPKGEKARLNGSQAYLRSRASQAAATRCFQCDHTNQIMAANSTNLHAKMKAVKNLLEARVRIP